MAQVDGEGVLQLDASGWTRTHNRVFIPANAELLAFRMQRVKGSDDDQLEVRIGDGSQATQRYSLKVTDPEAINVAFNIPSELRGTEQTITFELVSANGVVNFESIVQLDGVRFVVNINQQVLAAQRPAE